jgi:uncharacterized protein YgiB involved in biofilm formation
MKAMTALRAKASADNALQVQGLPEKRHRMLFLLTSLMIWPGAFLIQSGAANAQSQVPAQATAITYASRAACEQADRLTTEQCGFAFLNARAEFEEKAPRFRGRGDCERAHKTCVAQIVGLSGFNDAAKGASIYVPRFQGVTLSAGKGDAGVLRVLPQTGAAKSPFRPRRIDALEDKVDGRVAVVPDSSVGRGARGTRSGGNDPQSSGPYVRRGDRDDTIRQKLEVRNPNDPSATGLFVDKDGVEWYRPARRR